MPKLPSNYQNTIIYKIVCNDLSISDIYVGYTTVFTKRKSLHKLTCNSKSNNYYNRNVYNYIRENGGWDNFSMVEIEKYPCNDGNEARKRARFFYELLNAKLNCKKPSKYR
jgi:hypothetical protein